MTRVSPLYERLAEDGGHASHKVEGVMTVDVLSKTGKWYISNDGWRVMLEAAYKDYGWEPRACPIPPPR